MTVFEIVISCAVGVIALALWSMAVFGLGFVVGRRLLPMGEARPMQQFVRNESAERRIEELLTNAEQELHSMASGAEPPKPEYPGSVPARY